MLSMEANIRPPFSIDEARAILQKHYDIQSTTIKPLPSELDRNYHFHTKANEQYVLKIAHSSVSDAVLDLQNRTLKHLRATLNIVPESLPAKNGADIISLTAADGKNYRARLLRYIEGDTAQRLPPALRRPAR